MTTQRQHLFRAAELGQAASDAATIAASFSSIQPHKVERFCMAAEEAAYALLDAIAEARMSQPRTSPLMAEMLSAFVPGREVGGNDQPEKEAA